MGRVKAVPNEAILEGPHLLANHIDGPLLSWAGEIYWLTWSERISLRFGWTTVDRIACKRWPYLRMERNILRSVRTALTEIAPGLDTN